VKKIQGQQQLAPIFSEEDETETKMSRFFSHGNFRT